MSASTTEAPVVLEHAGAGTDGDQYADSTAIVLDVDSILVADRYRKDLGDLSDLKQSIVYIGILNPITVTEYYGGYKLLAGERRLRSEEHTSELQSLMRISYAVFCLKKKKINTPSQSYEHTHHTTSTLSYMILHSSNIL